jgi:hypothetical protein
MSSKNRQRTVRPDAMLNTHKTKRYRLRRFAPLFGELNNLVFTQECG